MFARGIFCIFEIGDQQMLIALTEWWDSGLDSGFVLFLLVLQYMVSPSDMVSPSSWSSKLTNWYRGILNTFG